MKPKNQDKLSRNEGIKTSSQGLRGTLKESLVNNITGALYEDDQDLIKFHGIYGQDDRDRRSERAHKKLERLFSYMIRLRIPGGLISSATWLKIHETANQYSTGIIKITTRQTIQLHGIIKSKLKPTIKSFDLAKLDSIAACGDVNRNVICTAHPSVSPVYPEIQKLADKISLLLLPKTRAYYEIWLDQEPLLEKSEEDPLYQDHYLPRKFKIAIAIPPSNDVDVFANDIGIIAVIEKDEIKGFNLSVGGGLGTTHGNDQTYPRLGTDIGFVSGEENLMKVIYQIVTIQRDFGNRSDRKLSRFKYTLDKMGLEAFKRELEERTHIVLENSRPYHFQSREDDYGWKKDHLGFWHYTIFIENGRILDRENYTLKNALFQIAKTYPVQFRFTANQHLIIGDIKEADKTFIQSILFENGVNQFNDQSSPLRKNSMACVAFNTCPLALAEGQRYLPDLITRLDNILEKYKLGNEKISIRMTGCPNGCARPYLAEIGLIGTAYGKYNMHLGGSHLGTRLNTLYKENLEEKEILEILDQFMGLYSKFRLKNESFGDYWNRTQTLQLN